MKSPLTAALMAASALAAVPALAFAGETTIIHEKTVVVPAQPAPAATETQTQTEQTASVHHVAVHRVVRHRTAMFHHVVRHAPAPAASATSAGVQTSAAVRQDDVQAQTSPAQAAQPQVVEERRTVIRRDDEGDVERHTRIIRQGPDGMTSIEHRSAEGVSADAPAP